MGGNGTGSDRPYDVDDDGDDDGDVDRDDNGDQNGDDDDDDGDDDCDDDGDDDNDDDDDDDDDDNEKMPRNKIPSPAETLHPAFGPKSLFPTYHTYFLFFIRFFNGASHRKSSLGKKHINKQ